MHIAISLTTYVRYLEYMLVGGLMVALFIYVYTLLTPIKEFALIRQGQVATAFSLGGAVIGFSLTLSASIANSDNLLTFIVWGVCASVVQLLAFFIVARLIPDVYYQLDNNNVAVGGFLASISLAIGLINAACLHL